MEQLKQGINRGLPIAIDIAGLIATNGGYQAASTFFNLLGISYSSFSGSKESITVNIGGTALGFLIPNKNVNIGLGTLQLLYDIYGNDVGLFNNNLPTDKKSQFNNGNFHKSPADNTRTNNDRYRKNCK